MSTISVSLICCDSSPDQRSQVVEATLDSDALQDESGIVETVPQQLPADLARGLHLAAAHEEAGTVTYLQEVHEGGFFVYVGDPDNLQEHWFGPGSWAAFNDNQGSGHASKVGPEGCHRTMRILKGHFQNGHWPGKPQ